MNVAVVQFALDMVVALQNGLVDVWGPTFEMMK